MENRQHRGIGAEHLVIFDLLERGLSVETPILPNSVHDLSSSGLRIQVKCESSDGTKIAVDIRRPSAKDRRYSPSDIDVFAIVDPLSRRVAYVPINEVRNARKLTLYLVRDHGRSEMRSEYEPIYFDDYVGIEAILDCKSTDKSGNCPLEMSAV